MNACLQLGFPGHYEYGLAGDRYGTTNGPIRFYGLECVLGTAIDADPCMFAEWTLQEASCDHNQDVAVRCVTGE